MATVGLTESLLTLIYTLAVGLSIGASAMVARRIGEQDYQGAAQAAAQTLLLGVSISVVLGVVGSIFAPELLGLMGASPEVVAYGSGYTRVLLGGNIVIIMLFLVNAIFRGAGDGAIAMRALWLANGINILLCPCFIMGLGPFPELGVMGASVATTIGRGTGALYVLSRLFPWQRSGQAESFASQSEHERDGHFGEAVFERHVSGLHRHGELDRLDEDSFKLRQHGDRGIHDRHPNHLVRALSFLE